MGWGESLLVLAPLKAYIVHMRERERERERENKQTGLESFFVGGGSALFSPLCERPIVRRDVSSLPRAVVAIVILDCNAHQRKHRLFFFFFFPLPSPNLPPADSGWRGGGGERVRLRIGEKREVGSYTRSPR